MFSDKRRVVVTGLGIVSPVGNDVQTAWKALCAGQSGVRAITSFDASQLPTKIAAQVLGFDPLLSLSDKEVRRTDMFVQYAAEAARQAILDSGLHVTEELSPRVGVAIGSGIGGLPGIRENSFALDKGGPRKISPFFIPGSIINMAAGLVSMKHHLMGPNISIVTACTTGAHNIGHAARMIIHGDAEAMLAGGAEMSTIPLGVGGFNAIKALSTRNDQPEKACRPWDKDRDGFILGEGAGVLVLEELEFAKRRGARIYAELAGFGMSGDAYHMTAPCPDGAGFVLSMQSALKDAGVSLQEVDYINAHATSTMADAIEAFAVKRTFGEHAYKLLVSSTKSMTGHLLGAAGAVEAIISVLAIRDQIAPPTINLDNPDEGCDLNFVAHSAQTRTINVVLSNSFGFGGTNGTLVFRRLYTSHT
jgi:3-oxoacyl-[acyl-carrier-protein] synthase II